ncbi:MAG: hypothetical protein ACE5O2_11030 [Armatimonadota bacterium]
MSVGQEPPSAADRLTCPNCGELMFRAETRCVACGHIVASQQPRPAQGSAVPEPPGVAGQPSGANMGALQAEIAGATKIVKVLCLLFGGLLILAGIGLMVMVVVTKTTFYGFHIRGIIIAGVVLAAGIGLVVYGARRKEWWEAGS